MTTTTSPSAQITAEVTSWPGVEGGPGRRGEFAFKVGRHEIGHLHGDRSAHFFFSRSSGTSSRTRAGSPTTQCSQARFGPAARRIENQEDVDDVIAMMRLDYDRFAAA